jgi:hypothetical protein
MKRIDWSTGWNIIINVTDLATEILCKTEAIARDEQAMRERNGDMMSAVIYDDERDAYIFSVYDESMKDETIEAETVIYEYVYRDESIAHKGRQTCVKQGKRVTDVVYDPTRNKYVFNLLKVS